MSGLKVIDALVLRMKDLQAKQTVVSQNIANADTPGYRTRVVRSPDFGSLVDPRADGPIARPFIARPAAPQGFRALGQSTVATESAEEKPNGNNVDLEEQVLAMGQIQSDYQQAASLYRRSVGLLKIALGR